MNIDILWARIKNNQGNIFYTVTGLPFTYKIINDEELVTNRTNWIIRKKDFERAIEICPTMVSDLTNLINGPSYVFSILKKLL